MPCHMTMWQGHDRSAEPAQLMREPILETTMSSLKQLEAPMDSASRAMTRILERSMTQARMPGPMGTTHGHSTQQGALKLPIRLPAACQREPAMMMSGVKGAILCMSSMWQKMASAMMRVGSSTVWRQCLSRSSLALPSTRMATQ